MNFHQCKCCKVYLCQLRLQGLLRNSTCFAESDWKFSNIKSLDKFKQRAVKNIPVESITHSVFWTMHLVIPKLTHMVLDSVCVIEYHYCHGKTALMIPRLLRVLLNIWYNRMSLSLGIWFYFFLPPLLRTNSGNLPLKMNNYREHATYQTNSLSLKSCQMNMLPFMDLKCILNPQHHITISLR